MRQYIADNIIAAFITDADGNPTPIDIIDWQGVSLLSGQTFTRPNAFAANQWSMTAGPAPREITINVSVLPANGGSPLTAIQYRIASGAWVTLPGTGTGPRTVTMAAASTQYDISLRAVNVIGPSDPSAAKTITSGAPAANAPAAFAPAQWSVTTGTGPSEILLNIISLPGNGGSAITDIEYVVGTGEWVSLASAETGVRGIPMPDADAAFSIAIRALNAVGAGPGSAPKTATSAGPGPAPETAPVVVSATIAGNNSLTGTLTLNVVATGNPLPSVISAQWTLDGEPIPEATAISWIKAGAAHSDVISASGFVSNGVGDPVPFTVSNPVTLTAPGVELVAPLDSIGLTVGDEDLVVRYPYDDETGEGHFRHATSYVRTPATAPAGVTYNADGHVISAAAVRGAFSITVKGIGAGGTEVSSTATYSVAAATAPGTDPWVYLSGGTGAADVDPAVSFTLTLDPPHVHAGTHTITPAMMTDMANGPVCLVPPVIEIDGSQTAYSVTRIGLWAWDNARGPVGITRSWRRAGVTIAGQAGMTLAFDASHRTVAITAVETATQGVLTRTQASNGVTVPANSAPESVFAAASSTPLKDWSDPSGLAWTEIVASDAGGTLNVGTDRLHGGRFTGAVCIRGAADQGVKQFATGQLIGGFTAGLGVRGHAIGVRVQGLLGYWLAPTSNTDDADPLSGKAVLYYISGAAGTQTVLGEWVVDFPRGSLLDLRLEVDGSSGQQVLTAYRGSTLLGTYTDTSASKLTGGGVGVRAVALATSGSGSAPKLKKFNGGSLA